MSCNSRRHSEFHPGFSVAGEFLHVIEAAASVAEQAAARRSAVAEVVVVATPAAEEEVEEREKVRRVFAFSEEIGRAHV